MPYIEVKLAKQASRKQERILTEKLGEAITSVPGKTAAGLMVSISSDEHIYKGGEFLEYGAYVNVVFKHLLQRNTYLPKHHCGTTIQVNRLALFSTAY